MNARKLNSLGLYLVCCAATLAGTNGKAGAEDQETNGPRRPVVQLGPRPFYLLDRMADSPLKRKLEDCASERQVYTPRLFAIGHRGAALMFPEHTRESYMAAARIGAGIIECDVSVTKDLELVCRHS